MDKAMVHMNFWGSKGGWTNKNYGSLPTGKAQLCF